MAINLKNQPILVILHQLLEYRYNQTVTFNNNELERKRADLEEKGADLKKQSDATNADADKTAASKIDHKINQINHEINLISDKIKEHQNKNQAELKNLGDKFHTNFAIAGSEYKNDLPIDKYLREHPDLFKPNTRELLFNFSVSEGLFGEIKTNEQLTELITKTDLLITEILQFCSEKPDLKFEEHELKELNAIIKSVKSTEPANSLHQIVEKETKIIVEMLVTHATSSVIRSGQNVIKIIEQYHDARIAPYMSEHAKLTANVNELMNNQDISLQDRPTIVKSLLKNYIMKHNLTAVTSNHINSLERADDYIECLDEILAAQKLVFDETQKTKQLAEQEKHLRKENSISSFYTKINAALHDERYAKHGRALSNQYKNALLKKICDDLLSFCLRTNEDLKSLELESIGNQGDAAYCEQQTQRILDETKTPEKFAQRLKEISSQRRNCDKPYLIELFYGDAQNFVGNYATALMGIAASAGAMYVYHYHKESIKEYATSIMDKAYQGATYSAKKGSELIKDEAKKAIMTLVGIPVVNYLSATAQKGITHFFQSPKEESPEDKSQQTQPTSTSVINTNESSNTDDDHDGDKLQKTPKK